MTVTKMLIVGAGGMMRSHLKRSIMPRTDTSVAGMVEPSDSQREKTKELFEEQNMECPPFFNTVAECIDTAGVPDAAFICTPHKFHKENSIECLKAGMDVLLEKPMVINGAEAKEVIDVRDETGNLFVVAFPGSLSPATKKAKEMIAAGEIGKVSAVAAFANQNWKKISEGTWRQNEEISGGGFLFDTGSHMINTVVDIVGENVTDVAAIMDNRDAPVEIVSSVSARTENNVLISLAGVGDSINCESQIIIFGEDGLLETGIWGGYLKIKKADDEGYTDVPLGEPVNVWDQFLKVRAGEMENPCPAEVGLRFARLMDMIRESARAGKTARR